MGEVVLPAARLDLGMRHTLPLGEVGEEQELKLTKPGQIGASQLNSGC
jgi:hypothetical protein